MYKGDGIVVCTKCNGELRIAPEHVGVDSSNMPVYHRFGYCDRCMAKWDLDILISQTTQKKKDSVLSIVAAVFSLFTITFFIGIIIGLIDLGINDKNKRHLGSWFAVIWGIIAGIVLFIL